MAIGYAPAWSPDAERLAFVTRGDLWVADADGSHRSLLVADARQLARGAHPDWSPDGERLAFDRDGETYTARWWYGGAQRDAGAGTDPAYAPDGRLAVVDDGQISVAGTVVAEGTSPDWSADGRLAWVRDGWIYIAGKRWRRGAQPAWPPARKVRELLPDFDQRAPSGLVIAGGTGRWLL